MTLLCSSSGWSVYDASRVRYFHGPFGRPFRGHNDSEEGKYVAQQRNPHAAGSRGTGRRHGPDGRRPAHRGAGRAGDFRRARGRDRPRLHRPAAHRGGRHPPRLFRRSGAPAVAADRHELFRRHPGWRGQVGQARAEVDGDPGRQDPRHSRGRSARRPGRGHGPARRTRHHGRARAAGRGRSRGGRDPARCRVRADPDGVGPGPVAHRRVPGGLRHRHHRGADRSGRGVRVQGRHRRPGPARHGW